MSPLHATFVGLAGIATGGIVVTTVAVLAQEIRHKQQQLVDQRQNLVEQDRTIAGLRRDQARKAAQIALLMEIVEEWTRAWEARGGEVIRLPDRAGLFDAPQADVAAAVVDTFLTEVERHANQGGDVL